MRYPPSFIERLRSHFALSELIGRRISLKKQGREYAGLCPFHGEKTPSFTVNNEKGFYHCFGCGAHGDAIEFLKQYERLTYPEAVEKLAAEAGLALPAPTPETAERARAEKTLLDVTEAACRWFEANLAAPEHFAARDYLHGRGLAESTQRAFRIGYAPDQREGLKRHLLSQRIPEALIVEAGLLVKPDDGAAYDRFRGRVIIPIRNTQGRVIAFGGRLLAEGGGQPGRHVPKYLNSSETPLFKKGEVLFNLDRAGKTAREKREAVIVEGYMDVISLAQAGVENAVATLGTAVTPEHLRKLWQYAPEPVLCLDGDAAGGRAMQRAAEIGLPLLTPGNSLRFAILPAGDDPDTYVQKNGAASFEALLAAATGLPDALWRSLRAAHPAATVEGLGALEKACAQTLEKIQDATVRRLYQKEFSGHLAYLREQLWQKTRRRARNEQARSSQVVQVAAREAPARFDALFLHLLRLFHAHPALAHHWQAEETIARMELQDAALEALRHALLEALHGGTEEAEQEARIRALCGQTPASSLPAIRQALTEDEAARQWEKLAAACEMGHLHAEMDRLRRSLEEEGGEAALAQLQAVSAQINELKIKQNTLVSAGAEE